MRWTIGALCISIVALQILIGVPLAVCLAFYFVTGSGGSGPLTVEMHANGPAPPVLTHGAMMAPPANVIPQPVSAPLDNPILVSRAEHGSLLAGTVLGESMTPDDEQQLFAAAFEKVAAEQSEAPKLAGGSLPMEGEISLAKSPPDTVDVPAMPLQRERQKADELAIGHLYEMATADEQAGQYERADRWRALARDIRRQRDREPERP